jgi:hypothetical protein
MFSIPTLAKTERADAHNACWRTRYINIALRRLIRERLPRISRTILRRLIRERRAAISRTIFFMSFRVTE